MKIDFVRATAAHQYAWRPLRIAAVCLALLAGMTVAHAAAQLPPPANQAQDAQRQRLALLKFTALQTMRTTLAHDLVKTFPAESRVSIYLDVDVDSFVLQHIELFIDERAPLIRNYSAREAGALLRQSTHRVLRDNFIAGEHHIRIEYAGQKRGAKPDDPVITGKLELDFEATPHPQAFVLPVKPATLASRFGFFTSSPPKQWAWEDETEDPRIGLVRFLRDIGLEFAGLRELLEIAGAPGNDSSLPIGYYRLLMHTYIDLGMREQAVLAAEKAKTEGQDGKLVETPGQTLTDAWLRLAMLDYRRGDYLRALYTLDNIEAKLSESQQLLRLDLKSRVQLAQADYPQAARTLAQANEILDDDAIDLFLPYLQRLYLRYNYALALIKSGEIAQGRTLLDRVGSVTQANAAERAVRDQANLALAYHLLRASKGASAKNIFQRIPLSGSYTNNALLGLGWTELAPAGGIVEKASPGTFGSGWGLGDFTQAELQTEKSEQLRRALVSWDELAKRNPDDAAVQEALVVIPFALEELEQREQAGQAYEKAIASLTQTRRQLSEDIDSLRDGLETRALLYRYASSGLPYTRWTDDIRTSNPVEEYVENFHDLQRLQGALISNSDPNAALLNNALGYAAVAQMREAQVVIANALTLQLERIENYRTVAINGLTRYYDWKIDSAQVE